MRELRRVDFTLYPRALVVYVKNPVIALAPLAATFADIIVRLGDSSGIGSLLTMLLDGFSLAVAIILADLAWGKNRARFDLAWNVARGKISDILMATLGLGFVLFVGGFIGHILGTLVQGVIQAIALGFLLYALPAAAIGGIPGSAALQLSIDRARDNPGTTIALTVIVLAVYLCLLYGDDLVTTFLSLGTPSAALGATVGALTRAVALGYVAVILAKVYSDISYGRRF